MEYPIGTQFKTHGKQPHVCTVIDILKTHNDAGELVRTRYVATHEFCGQTVTDRDVCDVTIARGFISNPFPPIPSTPTGNWYGVQPDMRSEPPTE